MNPNAMAFSCPACGAALPAVGACGASCPAAGRCALVCCPGCGAALPDPQRSRLAFWLARWLAARRRRAVPEATPATVPAEGPVATTRCLSELASGSRMCVVALGSPTAPHTRQLAALGIVPGTALRLRQRRPTFVVEVGQTLLALDAALASEIRVAPADERSGAQPVGGMLAPG